jgi:hypothetical protein
VGVVDKPVEDTIRQGGIADLLVPTRDRQLRCTSAKSVEPTPMISQAPKEAAARVQA